MFHDLLKENRFVSKYIVPSKKYSHLVIMFSVISCLKKIYLLGIVLLVYICTLKIVIILTIIISKLPCEKTHYIQQYQLQSRLKKIRYFLHLCEKLLSFSCATSYKLFIRNIFATKRMPKSTLLFWILHFLLSDICASTIYI